jgi:hypothetical protein
MGVQILAASSDVAAVLSSVETEDLVGRVDILLSEMMEAEGFDSHDDGLVDYQNPE